VPQAYSIVFGVMMVSLLGYTRIRSAVHGTKVYQARLYALSIFYVIFTSYLTFNSFSYGVSLIYIAPYVLTFVGAEFLSNRYSDRTLSFWKTSAGNVYAKGGLAIYLIYISATAARIVISLFFLGSVTALFVYNPVAELQGVNTVVSISLIVSDFLLVIGAGLLIGLNRKINLHYKRIRQDVETVPTAW
jgi:hypothetical protein